VVPLIIVIVIVILISQQSPSECKNAQNYD
jgi:hypothetical protein